MSREVVAAGPARADERSSPARRRFTHPAAVLFALAAVVSLAVLSVMGSHLTFFLDDWDFLLTRSDPSSQALLSPHNEHLAVGGVLIYEALLHGFGMDSLAPFSFVADLFAVAGVVALFVWLRSRIGAWLALAATLPLLFLGTAAEDLLFPFQIAYFGSLAFGICALLALERDEPRFDRLACLAVVGSIAFSSVGLSFLVGAAVWVGWDARRWRRSYVVWLPALLYALWWIGWGHEAQSHVSLSLIAAAPSYVLDGFASSLSSLFGQTAQSGAGLSGLDWGRALLAAALVLAGWRVLRGPRLTRSFWVVLAIAIVYWGLAASSAYVEARAPTVGRYQYPGVFFLVMIVAELIRGVRLRRSALIVVFVVVAAATAGNLSRLADVYDAGRTSATLVRSDLAALEFARDNVAPGFTITADNGGTGFVPIQAGAYLPVAEAFGSPAYSKAELPAQPEAVRTYADTVSAAANGLVTRQGAEPANGGGPPPDLIGPQGASATPRGSCLDLRAPPGVSPVVELPPGGVAVANDGSADATVSLRRWASAAFPINAGPVSPRSATAIEIPTDHASRPWQLQVESSGPVSVSLCGLGV